MIIINVAPRFIAAIIYRGGFRNVRRNMGNCQRDKSRRHKIALPQDKICIAAIHRGDNLSWRILDGSEEYGELSARFIALTHGMCSPGIKCSAAIYRGGVFGWFGKIEIVSAINRAATESRCPEEKCSAAIYRGEKNSIERILPQI